MSLFCKTRFKIAVSRVALRLERVVTIHNKQQQKQQKTLSVGLIELVI